jgi:hypothetical protein
MMKALATLATFLLAATLGFAQAEPSGTQSSQSSGGQSTIRGCLTGASGNYRLVTKEGTSYKLKGRNSDLAENVGREVEVRTNSTIAPQASASASTAGKPVSAATTQTLQVQDVTQIADICQSDADPSSDSHE